MKIIATPTPAATASTINAIVIPATSQIMPVIYGETVPPTPPAISTRPVIRPVCSLYLLLSFPAVIGQIGAHVMPIKKYINSATYAFSMNDMHTRSIAVIPKQSFIIKSSCLYITPDTNLDIVIAAQNNVSAYVAVSGLSSSTEIKRSASR